MTAKDRQDALIIALDEAVGGALRRYGLPLNARQEVLYNAMRAALVDGLQVLAREFGPRPEDARDEARELPSAARSLILGYVVDKRDFPDGVAMQRNNLGSWRPLDKEHFKGFPVFYDEDITDWVPARVVRDDEKGPAAALRRILTAIERDDIGCMGKLQGVEFEAREALKALGGEG